MYGAQIISDATKIRMLANGNFCRNEEVKAMPNVPYSFTALALHCFGTTTHIADVSKGFIIAYLNDPAPDTAKCQAVTSELIRCINRHWASYSENPIILSQDASVDVSGGISAGESLKAKAAELRVKEEQF